MANTNMDAFDIELAEATQRSDQWRDIRLEKFTSSENSRLMTPVIIEREMTEDELAARPKKGKGSRTATIRYEDEKALAPGAITYIKEKVAEGLTGQMVSSFKNASTDWGETQEVFAKIEFMEQTGLEVKGCGFVQFTDHSGGSPDGLVEDDAILEVKCPHNSTNQVEYLLLETVEEFKQRFPDFYWQMQHNMLVTKRSKGYFATYDPRMPKPLRLKILEVPADPTDQQRLLVKLDLAILMKNAIKKQLLNEA